MCAHNPPNPERNVSLAPGDALRLRTRGLPCVTEQRRLSGQESVLESVLEQCICLQYLIVAFTPHLYTDGFFSLLGRRCWSMQCFLVL